MPIRGKDGEGLSTASLVGSFLLNFPNRWMDVDKLLIRVGRGLLHDDPPVLYCMYVVCRNNRLESWMELQGEK